MPFQGCSTPDKGVDLVYRGASGLCDPRYYSSGYYCIHCPLGNTSTERGATDTSDFILSCDH